MSSTAHAAFSISNVQLIIDALADHAKITGIDLSNNPFAASLEQLNSSEAILQLLQEREKAFNEYRDGSWRLINCLSPAVRVLQAFSAILDKVASLVSHIPSREPSNVIPSGSLPTGKRIVCRD